VKSNPSVWLKHQAADNPEHPAPIIAIFVLFLPLGKPYTGNKFFAIYSIGLKDIVEAFII